MNTDATELDVRVNDIWKGDILADERLTLKLESGHVRREVPLATPARNPFGVEQEPCLVIRADRNEPDGPKTAAVRWPRTLQPGDIYTIQVEQVDGTFAWSSPIWVE